MGSSELLEPKHGWLCLAAVTLLLGCGISTGGQHGVTGSSGGASSGGASSGGAAGGGGSSAGSGAAGGTNDNPSFFIAASFDGEPMLAADDAGAYYWTGLADGTLMGSAKSADWTWSLYLRNAAGEALCGTATITLQERALEGPLVNSLLSGLDGAPCELTLTRSAPEVGDVVEGSFSGVVREIGGGTPTHPITDGVFRLKRQPEGPPPP